MSQTIVSTDLAGLNLVHRGKVRDMYAIPGHDDKLLMVATDRISAYDVAMDDPVPNKGCILTQISLFWFDLLGDTADYTRNKGIIIAGTKFEIGLLGDRLILIDEVLSPDSSRFWPVDDNLSAAS